MTNQIAGLWGTGSLQLTSGASPYSTPTTKYTNLFQTIDTTGTGSITQNQFHQAFSTLNPPGRFQSLGASAIFKQLDPQGTGSVSKSDFVNGLTSIASSLGKTGTINGVALATPAQSLSQSQLELNLLGQQATAKSGPGSIVNKVV